MLDFIQQNKNIHIMKIDHKAFTLAEVLITLLIIGVIASIVIPNLLNDSRNAELDSSLKEVYAELSQTTKQIIMDNGGTFVGLLANDTDHLGFRNSYSQYLNFTKICTNVRAEGCWHPLSTDGGTWKYLSGSSTDACALGAGLILSNGILVNFRSLSRDCSHSDAYYTKPLVCGWIIIDVNGFKLPNRIGKDVFYFNILADRLEPWGTPNSAGQTCSGGGLYCTVPKLMQ